MKKYFLVSLVTIVSVLVLVGVINWIINPYAVFESVELETINKIKTETKNRQRLSKTYEVAKVKPQVIYLGNSRTNALREDFPGWKSYKVYNFALDSGGLYELWRYLQHAQQVSPLKEVVLSIDYFAFDKSPQPSFKEGRLSVDANFVRQTHIFGVDGEDMFASLLSISALKSSLRTVQSQSNIENYSENRRRRILENGGHRKLFEEMETGILRHAASRNGNTRATVIDYQSTLAYKKNGVFRKTLRFAHAYGIKLDLYFSPVHARMMEVWRIAGYSRYIESVKKAVVLANAEEATSLGVKPFAIWDFSGYNSITTEALPAKDDVDKIMYGYWEGSHFSRVVADLILSRIVGVKDVVIPEDFGVLVTPQNIDQVLAVIRENEQQYRQTNSKEIGVLENLFLRFQETEQPDQTQNNGNNSHRSPIE